MASKVDELPTELIVRVFAELNCADLVRYRETGGVCKLRYVGDARTLYSFAFLSERHVLLGLAQRSLTQAELQARDRTAEEPQLLVVDFLAGTGELVKMHEADFLCAFYYPSMVREAVPLGITIRSDSEPGWTSHPDSPVPFFTARGDRLLVITFIIFSGETKRRFSWDEWGPNQTQMIRKPRHHSDVWARHVFGMRCTTLVDLRAIVERHRSREKEKRKGKTFGSEDHWMSDETEMPEGIFGDKVATSLPYHMRTMIPPRGDGEKDFECVMLSEDTIIVVMCNDERHHRNTRLLTFWIRMGISLDAVMRRITTVLPVILLHI
ncbi:uncharacterized protein C8Q71DRAFT_907197 [Rhodofomes roseus]|uniref:F-box domain-containing protein n=1 Tax=Rhodofomes roseus TaxID=34475 RepID=A0ABQ8KHM4_9APHY|nr:uncharacterized protein C8Q71DRAFT_907197 [Rhodofomes roseus]KAH9837166.1 hypothetical protein C8Q71DRAFT_907197 [Rhodofomes roseus]